MVAEGTGEDNEWSVWQGHDVALMMESLKNYRMGRGQIEKNDLNMGIIITSDEHLAFTGGTVVKNLPAKAKDTRDASSLPGLGRSPGLGNGHLLQYSCLKNPTVRGAWQATVDRVAKSWTRLIDWEHTMSTYYVPDTTVICLDFPFSMTLIGSIKHKRRQRHHEFLGKLARITWTVMHRATVAP